MKASLLGMVIGGEASAGGFDQKDAIFNHLISRFGNVSLYRKSPIQKAPGTRDESPFSVTAALAV